MAVAKCEKCSFRAKYDNDKSALLGRLWRWHIGWCPGWNKYISSVSKIKRMELEKQYDLKKK